MDKLDADTHDDAFLILGHDDGVFHYLPKGSGQVVELSAEHHVEGRLIALSSRQWWEKKYGVDGKGVDWRMAQNALIQLSYRAGIFSPDRIRGRGGWWSGDESVLHLGNCLIIKGEEQPMSSSKRYIYEAAMPIRINYRNPLTAKEATAFSDICDTIAWDKPINSRYLAGWCAIAPICGALDWRPHIWLTGAAGTGKTFLLDKVVRRIVGDIGLSVQSATTEAGLRQTLRHDARPIMFDEIEGADMKAQARIQNILELARQASSESGASLIKGTVSGNAMTFKIRSCFAFSSIGVSATSRPDETRITVLGLKADGDRARFDRLANMIGTTLTEDYVQRFTARSVRMIPIIRENARIFSTAAAKVLGSQRAGDQIGALLAGAFSLHSDRAVTMAQATAWIGKQDWSESKVEVGDTDEAKCLAYLMQSAVKCPSSSGPRDHSIAELIEIAVGRQEATTGERVAAISTLGLYGFRADPDQMVISSTHTSISRLLRETEWAKTYWRTLLRLPGANKTSGTVRFGSVKTRGVELPYSLDEDESDR